MSIAITAKSVVSRRGAASWQLLMTALAAVLIIFPAIPACGRQVGSLSWSPDGKYVAVVDLVEKPHALGGERWREGTIRIVYADSIGHRIRVKDTIRRTAAQGIPSAVFWISPDEIAWASSDAQERFRFLVTALGSGKVRALGRRFRVSDSDVVRPPDAETYYPPDSLYWDTSGRQIVFCDYYPRQFPDGSIRYKFRIYNPWKDTLQTVTIPCRIIGAYLASFSGVPGVKRAPFLFSSSKDEHNYGDPFNYVFEYQPKNPPTGGLRRLEKNEFPIWSVRLSPNGRQIAWIGRYRKRGQDAEWENRKDTGVVPIAYQESRLIIKDLGTGGRKVVARCRPEPYGEFAWSPDGRKIVYADTDISGIGLRVVNVQ